MLGVNNTADQVKLLQLTINMNVLCALPDVIKEAKGTSNQIVEALQKMLHPSALSFNQITQQNKKKSSSPC